MKISTDVFDFDGPLVDSNVIKRRGFFDVVAHEPASAARMQAVLTTVQGDRHTIFESHAASRSASGFKGPDAYAIAIVGYGADDIDSARVVGCSFFPVGEARGVLPGT